MRPLGGKSQGTENEKGPKFAMVEPQPPDTRADAEAVTPWSGLQSGADVQANCRGRRLSEILASQAWEPERSHRNPSLCGNRVGQSGMPDGPLLPDAVPAMWRILSFASGVLSPSEVEPGVRRMPYQMYGALCLLLGIGLSVITALLH